MVSATTDKHFIEATEKNQVELPEILSIFAQVVSNPTEMAL